MTKAEIAMTASIAYTDALAAIRKAQALTASTGETWKATQPIAGLDRFLVCRA